MRIIINSGHAPNGSPDPGAVNSETGLQESIVNYDVSVKLLELLVNDGHEIEIIQDDNLSKICEYANELDADIFISIHCNSATNPAAHGTETYYMDGSIGGNRLAQYVHSELIKIGLRDRGTKTANFYVLKYTKMPAILVELAFISNLDEANFLASAEGQNKLAQAIYQGVKHYINEVIV